MTVTTIDFTGATDAAWPSGWSGDNEGGTNITQFDIESNRGRLLLASASFPSAHKVYDSLGAIAKMQVTATLDRVSTAESYQGVGVLTSASGWTGDEPANGYLTELDHLGRAYLLKFVGGVRTDLGFLATGLTVTNDHKVKLWADSSDGRVKAKVWAAAGAEPGSWQYDAIPTSPLLAAGRPALYGFGGFANGITLWWDDFEIDDLATGATQPPRTIHQQRLRRAA